MDYNKVLSSGAKRYRGPVLRFADRDLSLTYGDLLDLSGPYCALYREKGLSAGSRVALWMGNVPEYVLAYVAALRMGVVTVPLSVYERLDRVQSAADACGCGLLLYDSRNRHVRDALGAAPVPDGWMDAAAFAGDCAVSLPPYPAGETFAYDWGTDEEYCIMHSSGSTGQRKAIRKTIVSTLGNMHTVRALRLMIGLLRRLLPPFDLYNVCPFYHNTGNCMLMLVLTGMYFKQIVTENFNPLHAAQYLARERPNVWLGTASMLYRVCCANPAADLVYPSMIITMGEALSDNVIRTLSAQKGSELLMSFYGTTEAGYISSLICPLGKQSLRFRVISRLLLRLDLGGMADAPGTRTDHSSELGRISKGVEVVVRGEDGTPLPDGAVGEIVVKKEGAQRVYLDAESQADGLSTGDLGYKRGRKLYLLGRKKELIIRSGENIIPSEIEELLLACPGVADAVVCGVPSPDHGEDVCACLQPGDPPPDLEAVRAQLRDCLPGFMQPQHYLIRDSFPCNASGKTDRRRVAAEAKAALGL